MFQMKSLLACGGIGKLVYYWIPYVTFNILPTKSFSHVHKISSSQFSEGLWRDQAQSFVKSHKKIMQKLH